MTLYSGFFAALIWNDITDMEIDSIVHPTRPLPDGRINPKNFFYIAIIFSIFTFLFSFFISLIVFFIVLITALFVAIHNKYLKRKIKLPAFSEIFTPLQWVSVSILGFFSVWSNFSKESDLIIYLPMFENLYVNILEIQILILLIFFIYFGDNAHDIPEGIHDIEGDYKIGVRTYANTFGEKNAAKISFIMFFISGFFAILLYIISTLTLIFLIPFIISWIYVLIKSYSLININKNNVRKLGSIVGKIGFNYFLFTFDLIFLDIFIQLINFHFTIF